MFEKKDIAIMSYSFHGLHNCKAIDIFGYLESMKYRYNLTTADIWNGLLDDWYDDDYIDMVAKQIKERELTVVNFCCDEAHVWDNNIEKRKKNEKRARRFINIAEKIGAKSIRIDMGVRESNLSDEQKEYLVEKYTEYCELAKKFGARLGPENHWGASRNFPEFKSFVELMMSKMDNFGILLHLSGWNDTEDVDIKNNHDLDMVKYAMHMHIDYERSIKIAEIVPALLEKGYKSCWSIEHHSSTNEYNNVSVQLAMLRTALMPLNYDGAWSDAPPSVKE